ncbi:hypothetical protein [uncultured Bradyrhizobium sp.]|uniref:hypothetical protein n=1 Tax=uncultured Bradyrhizobium sp. TaxID=199684 RepID=UPI0026348C81|nr:hypothetical protein [uncultured Bradyrhizobium sp.]
MTHFEDIARSHTYEFRLRLVIEDLKHDMFALEENLNALEAFEHASRRTSAAQPLSVRNLRERRDNLIATIATLQNKLSAIE